MSRPLAEQIVVITGASSGIGRCAARYLAARGARVVLTARWEEALAELAAEIEAGGGRALAVPGDVAREEDMAAVADAAVTRFGRIDTWVNNAAVFIHGRVVDLTLQDYRDVLDVDLIGVINGTRQALRHMLPAGGGVIIQVSSIIGRRGSPFSSPYCAAKFGIDGFSDALRSEIWDSGVRIATLYLPTLDTPIYHHARTRFPTKPAPVPPIGDPAGAARRIAELAVEPRARTFHGLFHHVYLNLDRISPRFADWFLHHASGYTRGDLPAGGDNLARPMTSLPPTERGGWSGRGWRGFTLRNTVRALPYEALLAAAVVGFVAGRVLGRE